MSEKPTPETDAHETAMCRMEFDEELAMTYHIARKFERERDEAREQLDAERALADRLATTLKRWSNNDQANRDLAAWKEARK